MSILKKFKAEDIEKIVSVDKNGKQFAKVYYENGDLFKTYLTNLSDDFDEITKEELEDYDIQIEVIKYGKTKYEYLDITYKE